MRRQRRGVAARGGGTDRGFTTAELMVASVVIGIVLLAIVTMYIQSMQAWGRAGGRLALQRTAALGVERVLFDIRRGSRVEVTNGGATLDVYRATASGDSLIATYNYVDGTLQNQHGVALVDNVTAMQFTSLNNVKVELSMDLLDDMGTPDREGDDQRIELRTAAICRNHGL